MEITPANLTMLASLLTQSLSPDPATRHPAEKALHGAEAQSGFLLLVLALVEGRQVDAGAGGAPAGMDVRQAAGVYFKNAIKRRWEDGEGEGEAGAIAQADRSEIKARAVPIMVALSAAGAQRLQSQVGEAVAEIANADFPARWPTLVDVRAGRGRGSRGRLMQGHYAAGPRQQPLWGQFRRQQWGARDRALDFCGVRWAEGSAKAEGPRTR